MRSGILFALVSLAFAGFLDVSYKVFANRGDSRGCFLSAMGVVWLVLQAAVLAGTDQRLTLSSASWLFGLTAGVAVTLSNLAFIESMTVLNVSLSSTVYRLNTIGVMVLGLLFLGESVSLLNFAGIGLGIAAVLLLYQRTPGTDQETTSRAVLFLGIAVFASAARATFGVLTKAGLARALGGAAGNQRVEGVSIGIEDGPVGNAQLSGGQAAVGAANPACGGA